MNQCTKSVFDGVSYAVHKFPSSFTTTTPLSPPKIGGEPFDVDPLLPSLVKEGLGVVCQPWLRRGLGVVGLEVIFLPISSKTPSAFSNIVFKPQYSDIETVQIFSPCRIIFKTRLIIMTFSIQLNTQFFSRTIEIKNIRANTVLPSELSIFKSTVF